jgi:hypothetical protein
MSGRYNRVGSKKGPLVIGGAISKFETDPSFLYVPMYKVAGPKDEVTEWLQTHHPDDAKTAIKGSYSKTTLKNGAVRAAFDKEVEEASRHRQDFTQYRNEMKQVDLRVLVNILQVYDRMRKSDPDSVTISQKTSSRTMKDRLREIVAEGKFLDVSSMKEKGTEGKKVTLKKGSLKRRLSQNKDDDLHNVVYNPTSKSSIKGVEYFLKNYGGFSTSQINEIKEAITAGSVVNLSRTRSPTRSPLLSPKRAKKRNKARETTENDDLEDLLGALPEN